MIHNLNKKQILNHKINNSRQIQSNHVLNTKFFHVVNINMVMRLLHLSLFLITVRINNIY